jgi:hypothetical protein
MTFVYCITQRGVFEIFFKNDSIFCQEWFLAFLEFRGRCIYKHYTGDGIIGIT